MQNCLTTLFAAALAVLFTPACEALPLQDPAIPEFEQLGPDSSPQPGIPAGKLTSGHFRSTVFPDTVREYSVYVPAGYDGT
ncbi:MAG: esterase family protein, partial [Planctomycetaceae bacterium]